MTTKKQIKGWVSKIEQQRKKVAQTRDGLDDAIEEMTGLKDCCERAEEDLIRARDALSELA